MVGVSLSFRVRGEEGSEKLRLDYSSLSCFSVGDVNTDR